MDWVTILLSQDIRNCQPKVKQMLAMAEKSQCCCPTAVIGLATATSARPAGNICPRNCGCIVIVFRLRRKACAYDSHLVSLVPICCLDSSLSSSVCMGRMFFSSSSLLDGRLLSLMAKESFLSTFWASVPKFEMQNVKIVMVNRYWYGRYGKNKYTKMGFNVLIFAIWPLFSGSSRKQSFKYFIPWI